MRVAIIDGDISFPATSGKRLRTLNLMLPLAKVHKLTYIARNTTLMDTKQASAFFADHGIETVFVDDPLQIKHGPAFYRKLAGNLVSTLPYSVASHISAAMQHAVSAYAASHAVDLWQLEWSGYSYCLSGQTAPVVLQAHNVDAILWQRYEEAEINPLKRWYISQQRRKFRTFENSAFHRASRVVAVSAADAAAARGLYGDLPIDVIDNGVDVAAYSRLQANAAAKTILFLGALDWRPNLDALEILLGEIFPLVRALRPDAKLSIVGRNPPVWLRQRIENIENTSLSANVADVRPYLAQSSVMAVPLRIGGGSRLKILEALAAGLPVVSTSVGAEGLALTAGTEITLADTPQALADALVDSLVNSVAAQRQAERGRTAVSKDYDWNMLADRLGSVWEYTVENTIRRP